MIKNIRFTILIFVFAHGIFVAHGQSTNFIYADVVLKNKETVSGIIKWHDGQMLWTDVFVAYKNNTSLLKYLNKGELEKLSGQVEDPSLDWQFMNLWKDKLPERQTEILCRFGDIVSVHLTGPADAQVYYRNRSKSRVTITGQDGGPVKSIEVYSAAARTIPWNQISRINFRMSDYSAVSWKRKPLYGTVYTMSGPVTGYIRWDQSKNLSSQTLYGKNEEVIAGIKFWDIKKIAKKDKGAIVTFNSGKQVFMYNTRDVSAASRGIVVSSPDLGCSIVEWGAFKSVVFTDPPDTVSYASFSAPRRIYANVRTADGKIVRGNCSFDLDEEWDFELLEGTGNNIRYQIPFLNIAAMVRLNDNQSRVQLRNGKSLVLADHHDVSSQNWGLIIWLANSKYQYISWGDVAGISFR